MTECSLSKVSPRTRTDITKQTTLLPLPPPPPPRDALEGEGPQRQPKKLLDRRLEEVAKAVGGGYCRLQMPLKLALAVRETVAGRRLSALEGHKATDTELTYAPVSQAYGLRHKLQFNV